MTLSEMPNKTLIRKAITTLQTASNRLESMKQEEDVFLDESFTKIKKLSHDLANAHASQEKETQGILEGLETRTVKEASQKFLALQKKKVKLERLKRKASRISRRIEKKRVERASLKERLDKARQQVYKVCRQPQQVPIPIDHCRHHSPR